jgi:hypothetical protein
VGPPIHARESTSAGERAAGWKVRLLCRRTAATEGEAEPPVEFR